MTLVFGAAQALLAAEAGAGYVSCFIGRLEDIGEDAPGTLRDVVTAVAQAEHRPLVPAASIRNPRHAEEAAMLGADVATVPAKVLRRMTTHPLTEAGISRFTEDGAADPARARWLRDLSCARGSVSAGARDGEEPARRSV